jgi:hypothetical protein
MDISTCRVNDVCTSMLQETLFHTEEIVSIFFHKLHEKYVGVIFIICLAKFYVASII